MTDSTDETAGTPSDEIEGSQERQPIARRDDERAIEIAMFRYGVIGPLVDGSVDLEPGDVTRIVQEIASREHYLPGTGAVSVTERTIYEWKRLFLEGGKEGLRPKIRKDKGRPRTLPKELLDRAIELRREQKKRRTKTLIDIMSREGSLRGQPSFHRSTLDRYLDEAGYSRRQLKADQVKPTIKMRFEKFGDLWVGDFHHGPLIRLPDGCVRAARLGAFIDHTTRYPVAHRYYLAEDLVALRDCLLRALLSWGAPRRTYVDRGSIYRSDQLADALFQVDSHLIHSRAYYSEGRGVIEKWWQHANQFEDEVGIREELLTLHDLNLFWKAFCEERYCHEIHSELGRTPAEAVSEVTPCPIDAELARRLFRVKEKRTVHKKDLCVRVLGRSFLCDRSLRGRRVEVRFDPSDLRSVDVFLKGKKSQTAFPQPVNAPPEPHQEPEDPPRPSVDYLGLVRQDYEKELLEHARPLAYADLCASDDFDDAAFLDVVGQLAGLELRPSDRGELLEFWRAFGPLPEDLVRIGCEHAIRLSGRGRHPRVYLHAIRTLVLAHWKTPKGQEET